MTIRECAIRSAMPMVEILAIKYRKTRLGYEDAVAVGYLALVEAWKSFDPDLGVPFAGYAKHRVAGAMTDAQRRATNSRGGKETLSSQPMDPDLMAQMFIDARSTSPLAAAVLKDAIMRLPLRQRLVCLLRVFGMLDEEIGECLGVSGSRVSQVAAIAKRNLKGVSDAA